MYLLFYIDKINIMNFRVIAKISKFYSKEFLAYPTETISLIIRRFFEVGMLLLLWYLISLENNIDSLQIVPYILIASGVQFFSVGHNFRQAGDISEDIKFGKLTNALVKPINPLKFEFGIYLGRNAFEFVFSALNIIVGILLVSNLNAVNIVLFCLSLIPAFIIGYSFNILLASTTFWIIESGNLRLISYFILRMISGMFIPLTFFTGFWGVILQTLPFAQVAFVPSYIITGGDIQKSILLFILGLFWSVSLLILSYKIWHAGLRRYSAVGI